MLLCCHGKETMVKNTCVSGVASGHAGRAEQDLR